MSADGVLLGPQAKIDWNGLPYAVIQGSYKVTWDLVDRTDTEADVGKRTKRGHLRQLEADLTAQRADDVGYFGGPEHIGDTDTVGWLRIWPNGRGDAAGPIDCPQFCLGEMSGDLTVNGSAAQTLRISGRSDGDFDMPNE